MSGRPTTDFELARIEEDKEEMTQEHSRLFQGEEMPWAGALSGEDIDAKKDEEPRVQEMDDEQMRANDRDFANYRSSKQDTANFDGFSYRKLTDGLGSSYAHKDSILADKRPRPSRDTVSQFSPDCDSRYMSEQKRISGQQHESQEFRLMQKPTIESLPVTIARALSPEVTRNFRRTSSEAEQCVEDEVKDDESTELADPLPSVYVLNTNSNSKTFVANESGKKSLQVNSLQGILMSKRHSFSNQNQGSGKKTLKSLDRTRPAASQVQDSQKDSERMR